MSGAIIHYMVEYGPDNPWMVIVSFFSLMFMAFVFFVKTAVFTVTGGLLGGIAMVLGLSLVWVTNFEFFKK